MEPIYRCVVARCLDEIEPHQDAWRELMPRAQEDNFYLSPCFITAALKYHAAPGSYLVVFVYCRDERGEQLLAVAPFTLMRTSIRLPLPALCGLSTPHGYLSHPLLDRDRAGVALATLWAWLEQPQHPWRLVYFNNICETSPFLPLIKSVLQKQRRRFRSHRMRARPMLDRHADFDAYLASLPPARRKNYRRCWKHLEAAGQVEVHLHRALDDTNDLANRFMQIEQRSWKGMQGTAMGCEQADAEFFSDIVKTYGSENRLFFVELNFNGQLIAMTSDFICGQTLFAFKIAYDPAFQEFSPGMLVEIQTARFFHETPELAQGEGGTSDSSYLRSYWRHLVGMQEFYVAMPHASPRLLLLLLPFIWRAKNIYHWMTSKVLRLTGLVIFFSDFSAVDETLQICQLLT
jgi:CelD/BcsL family acetyltransferase involved in cellulose biosynthesis